MKMIAKKIDKDKLKVKHVLKCHSTLPGYPDEEDILYDLLIDFVFRIYTELKFTDVSLLKKYKNLKKEKLQLELNKLLNLGIISVVNSTSSYTTYEVLINPYE